MILQNGARRSLRARTNGYLGLVHRILFVFILAGLGINLNQGWTQPSGLIMQPGLQFGEITAHGGDTIEINRKEYMLHPNIMIKDEQDQSRELKDLRLGTLVWFHLKQGRIDQIVIMVPK